MPDIARLWQIIRQHPWYLVIPACLLGLSAAIPLWQRDPQYAVDITFVLTSGPPMNDTGDTLAYDFPAVSRGQEFRARVNALLDERAIMVSDGANLLQVGNHDREVTITAIGPDPAPLVSVRDAALAVLQRDGTTLWGKSGDTTVNIAVLRSTDIPFVVGSWIDLLAPLILRTLTGAMFGILLAVYRHS